jgi:hypothetical protein
LSSENTNQRGIWLSIGGTSRLFRLNTGRGYISGLGPKGVTRLTDGSVVVKAARPIALGFGLANGEPVVGAADLIGWEEVIITEAMIGHKVAIFKSIECKSSTGKGSSESKASADQKNWRDQVNKSGGMAGIASTPEEHRAIVNDWHSKFKQSSLL